MCQRGMLDLGDQCRYLSGLCSCLEHLHAIGVVHGDLALANILVSRACDAIMGDFGAAVAADSMLRSGGGEIATLYVRAPERLLLVKEEAAREADLWALGVIAVALSTGSIPTLRDSSSLLARLNYDLPEQDANVLAVFAGQVQLVGEVSAGEADYFGRPGCSYLWGGKCQEVLAAAVSEKRSFAGEWGSDLATRLAGVPRLRPLGGDASAAYAVAVRVLRWDHAKRVQAADLAAVLRGCRAVAAA